MLRVNNQDVESIEVYNEEDYENIKSFKIKQDDDIQIVLKEIYEFIKKLSYNSISFIKFLFK